MKRLPYEACKGIYDLIGFEPTGPEQGAVIESDTRFPCICGGERGGKALDIETPIPTPGGFVRMGDLRVGDTVFGDDGKPCRVVGAYETMHDRPCYRITFSDNTTIIADGDHRWAVQDENQRKNTLRRKVDGREIRVQPAALVSDRKHSVLTTEEIAAKPLVEATNGRSAFSRYSVLATLPVEYAERELPIAPYALGVWLGDGTAGESAFTSADPEVADRINGLGITVRRQPSQTYGYYMDIRDGLKTLNLLGNKHIPDIYLQASVNQRRELLCGLTDTAGYIDERGQCYFNNTNRAIIDGFVELCFSLGLKPTVTEGRAILNGRDVGPTWAVFFMAAFPVATIPRKAKRQNLSPANHARNRFIRSIEAVESRPVRCISVDSASHLYLAGHSYIPTHNTWSTALILLPHIVLLPFVQPDVFLDGNEPKFDQHKDKPRRPHFVLFGNTYKESREEFELVESWLRDLDLLCDSQMNRPSKPTEGSYRMITKYGVVISTWSFDDPRSVRAINLEGAAICEAGNCPYDGVERVDGRVSGTKGFIIYSGTLEHAQPWWTNQLLQGEHYNLNGFKTFSLPTYSNRYQFPGGENDPEIHRLRARYGEETFLMRVAAKPSPPKDRVLKQFTPDHIREVSVPDDAQFEIWIDPGYATAYAAMFVAIWTEKDQRKRFHVYDEIYVQHLHNRDVIELCQHKDTWKRIHDCIIDIGAKGHRDSEDSALEVWQRLTNKRMHYRRWSEDSQIERLNTTASLQQISIDPKCAGFISELGLGEPPFPGMHPWKYRLDNNMHIMSEKPIDRWNHAAKAISYGLLFHQGKVERIKAKKSWNRIKERAAA